MLHKIALILVVVLSGVFTSPVWAQEQETGFIKYKNILIPIGKSEIVDNQVPRFYTEEEITESAIAGSFSHIYSLNPRIFMYRGEDANLTFNLNWMLHPLSTPVDKWEVVKTTDDDYDSDLCPTAFPLPTEMIGPDPFDWTKSITGPLVFNSSTGNIQLPGIRFMRFPNLLENPDQFVCFRAINEYDSSISSLQFFSEWQIL